MADLSRGVPRTDASDKEAIATFLGFLPKLRDLTCGVDAVVVFPGMGEWQRVALGCLIHNRGLTKHLWIAHGKDERENYVDLGVEALKKPPYNLVRIENVIVGDDSFHTGHQAQFTLRNVKKLGVQSLVHVASIYHEYRALRTLLAALLNSDLSPVSVVPECPWLPPSTKVPESGLTYEESSPGETARSLTYAEKGDVLDYEMTLEYVNWFWQRSPLRHCIKDDFRLPIE